MSETDQILSINSHKNSPTLEKLITQRSNNLEKKIFTPNGNNNIENCIDIENYITQSNTNIPPGTCRYFSRNKNYIINPLTNKYLQEIDYDNYNTLNTQKNDYLEYKIKELNAEITCIKNDNIIFKEDIFKYSDINDYLKAEIDSQKEHNKYLLEKSDELINDNNNLHEKLSCLSAQAIQMQDEYEKLKLENSNRQTYLDNKLKQMNDNYNSLLNEKDELKNNYENLNNEYNNLFEKNVKTVNEITLHKQIQNISLNDIENKVSSILDVIEKLKKENSNISNENNLLKKKFEETNQDKEETYKKFQEQLTLYEKLNKDCYDSKINLELIKKKISKQVENENEKIKKNKKSKKNTTKDIIKGLQKQLQDYKIQNFKNNNKDD